jgi:hypothetical protein
MRRGRQNHTGDGPITSLVGWLRKRSTAQLCCYGRRAMLHPRVQKFVLCASNTGDLAEATEFAGLTEDQVAIVLPKLRVFLGSLVERPML